MVPLDLHRFRDRLSDGLVEHPFHGMELDEILGSLAPIGEIPHIPMDIAVPFLLVAVRWVREHGPEIADALEHSEEAYARAAASGKDVSICVWVMRTPMGDFGVVLLEGDDPVAANAAFASSQDPFDLWFKETVKEFTGIDFGQPLPPIDQLLDWRA